MVTATPQQPIAGQGTPATFRVRLINTGNVTERFNLSTILPPGIDGHFDQTSIEIPPGLDNYRDVLLTVTPARGATPGTKDLTVVAVSATQVSVRDEVTVPFTVVAQGVAVTVSPDSGSPGATFHMTVTNTGQAQDTFNLALGGPLGPAATLNAQTVTLAPGASQTVPIALGTIDFALPGALNFIAMATSQTNTAIRSAAMVQVNISTRQGLTVAFDPKRQTLPNPGLATFLLLVRNTGNTESAYRAAITGTNGPLNASIEGLDGQPTQRIETFRLPGLSTGAITVDATLQQAGTGKVTVEVATLDAALTGADTATVQTRNQPLPHDIPTLSELAQWLLLALLLGMAFNALRRSYR
ncbi:MAG: IPTL-CTERM sorting domain-containing protein [Candidatus Competibacter denitrificans]